MPWDKRIELNEQEKIDNYKRIELNEQEKIGNYSELRQELKKIWNLSQVVIIPVVIVALVVTSKTLKD